MHTTPVRRYARSVHRHRGGGDRDQSATSIALVRDSLEGRDADIPGPRGEGRGCPFSTSPALPGTCASESVIGCGAGHRLGATQCSTPRLGAGWRRRHGQRFRRHPGSMTRRVIRGRRLLRSRSASACSRRPQPGRLTAGASSGALRPAGRPLGSSSHTEDTTRVRRYHKGSGGCRHSRSTSLSSHSRLAPELCCDRWWGCNGATTNRDGTYSDTHSTICQVLVATCRWKLDTSLASLFFLGGHFPPWRRRSDPPSLDGSSVTG